LVAGEKSSGLEFLRLPCNPASVLPSNDRPHAMGLFTDHRTALILESGFRLALTSE
jgi:hypothetical protein